VGRRREARHLTGPGPHVRPLDGLGGTPERTVDRGPRPRIEAGTEAPAARLTERRRRWLELRRQFEQAQPSEPAPPAPDPSAPSDARKPL
jgi:hypothetical protein